MRNLLHTLFAVTLVAGISACNGDDDNGDSITGPCETDATSTCTIFTRSSLNVLDEDGNSVAAATTMIRDRGEGTGTMTMSNDTTYILDGLVFVNEGQTLTIEEGTVIKGNAGAGEQSSALVVARGGTINATGTAANPIIFTSVTDQTFSSPSGVVSTNNLDASISGLWGGVIILGNASLNSTPGFSAIEGISTNEARGLYGGDDDNDNSGIFRYVSIRHGGTDIGGGNEINGLTMGGVGSGTTIEYVEVFGNRDDGFEWFGGTVNTKYLVSAYNQDDAFDYDEGWRGKNQFWLAYQRISSDRGGEHDGGIEPETGTPYATPTIANASYFGRGIDAGKRAVTFRDNAGGHYYNSIFANYAKGIDIEYLGGDDVEDSFDRLQDGDLSFENNLLFNIGGSAFNVAAGSDNITVPMDAQDFASVYFSNNGNTSVTDPMFASDEITPMSGGAATANLRDNDDSFFTDVNYKGAIDPSAGPTWLANWTRLQREL